MDTRIEQLIQWWEQLDETSQQNTAYYVMQIIGRLDQPQPTGAAAVAAAAKKDPRR